VIDVHGQRVSATDRLHLLEVLPTLIVWGERDHTIPLAHGRAAHEAISDSRFRTLPGAAHFPHLEDPEPSPRCCASSSGAPRACISTTPGGVSSSPGAPHGGALRPPPREPHRWAELTTQVW